MSSLLVIAGIDLSDYAVRGLTQTLEPIDQARQMRRTVNGALVDVSMSQFRKYRSVIACADQVPPALDAIWPGLEVEVQCVAELGYRGSSGTPERTAVSGSERDEGEFTYYRPLLTMMVRDFRTNTDEYGAEVGWTIELEEV